MYKWKDSGRILDLIDMMIDSIHVILRMAMISY